MRPGSTLNKIDLFKDFVYTRLPGCISFRPVKEHMYGENDIFKIYFKRMFNHDQTCQGTCPGRKHTHFSPEKRNPG